MKKPQFVEGNIYHIYNRGVEKRNVFLSDRDRFRFIHDLYEFNDEDAVSNLWYYLTPKLAEAYSEVQPHYIPKERKKRKLLVEILAFVLMPNHFHLLLRQLKKDGIIRFMQKLGTGYTMYFNQAHERVGGLFQGRYKAVLVEREPHLTYLPFYIHANPLKIYRGSTSLDKQMRFLENYRWSSFPDYVGKKNFPSITSRAFLSDVVGREQAWKSEMRNVLRYLERNFTEMQGVMLDNDFDLS